MQFCGRVADFNKLPNLGFLLFLIYLFTIGLYFLALCVYKLALGHWRQLISVVIAPFVMFGVLYFQVRSDLSPNYLHFLIMRPWYFATVGQLTTDDAFHAWFWGSTGGGIVTYTYTVLIYDKTDQIARPVEDRTADWVNRVRIFASRNEVELWNIFRPNLNGFQDRGTTIKKLADHFYLVTYTS